ncbi:MAG: hypothetical protein GVY22_02115 [Gammaproteobacteria bacterium]|jgi:uncharacterized protein YjbJ (UPF0337 family)|nr:hypothetical protein [Gammaproteobacteria bacterium]
MNEKRLTRYAEEAKGPVMERTGKVVDSEALEIKDYNDQERARSQRIMEMSRKRSWLQIY